ncbi:MAG: type II toxin-antitoxin system RelE/ParE family toxin [Spirochaetaceae bacterium]|nr:type II toxin-antitoxin system RelE/ParE family toxin [Spirochaetaceae bacterium]
MARPGEGEPGGYRVILFFKSELRTFFVYGFKKSYRVK